MKLKVGISQHLERRPEKYNLTLSQNRAWNCKYLTQSGAQSDKRIPQFPYQINVFAKEIFPFIIVKMCADIDHYHLNIQMS